MLLEAVFTCPHLLVLDYRKVFGIALTVCLFDFHFRQPRGRVYCPSSFKDVGLIVPMSMGLLFVITAALSNLLGRNPGLQPLDHLLGNDFDQT